MITTKVPPTLSASTLKVFEDCQRRYEYLFLAPRPWPAPANENQEEAERLMAAGQSLHQLVHLHARGLDPAPLAGADPQLQRWYETYQASPFAGLAGETFSEQVLTLTVDGRKLVVKIDRLVREGDKWLIIDWKTSRRAPSPTRLQEDWQARLYPYALVEAGEILTGGAPIRPDDVEMVFYYLEPNEERRVPYSAKTHERVSEQLRQRIHAIGLAEQGELPPTGQANNKCEKPPCKFYSLCHMAALPASEWRPEEGDEEEILESLQLLKEFEFDDEPVIL